MFGIELLVRLHLCFVACEPTVFDVAIDICAGVEVVTKVVRGLIDLLVAVATPNLPKGAVGGRHDVNELHSYL